MYCKNCGREIKKDARFCPECGQEIQFSPDVKKEEVVIAEQKQDGVTADTEKEANAEMAPVMSVSSYVILFILSAIPIVGLILIIIFAIDSSNKNKRNYCRAIIVMWLIGVLIVVLFGASVFGFLYSL